MVQLGELMMILNLHRQGLSITAIARRTGRDPKTVRKYIAVGWSCRPTVLARLADQASSRPFWTICVNASPPART